MKNIDYTLSNIQPFNNHGIKCALLFTFAFILSFSIGFTQTITTQLDGSAQSSLQTAVPFLLINPQPRSGAMGNAGVAIEPDANSSSLNTAGLAFLPSGSAGLSFSYSPWLRQVVSDMDLSFISGYYRFNERNTISASFRYFSIGDIQMTDNDYHDIGVYSPNEFALDIGYARSFGPAFSLGGAFRFISSNLFSGVLTTGTQVNADKALAADVSGMYRQEVSLFGNPSLLSAGINISNIGTKIAYSSSGHSYFLPAALTIGTAVTINTDDVNHLTLALDFTKLLVPTQPIYDNQGNILKGHDPERSVPSGIFGSFSDAPGGFSEELKEVGISSGIEFTFQSLFSIRAGYNYRNKDKGNQSFVTTGVGIVFKNYSFDFAYIPGAERTNPMAGTLRFGLAAKLGGDQKNGNSNIKDGR